MEKIEDKSQTMDKSSTEYRKGMGNWEAWGDDVEPIFRAAEKWAEALKGVALPWLCWNVDSDWCLLQQRLVQNAGWTPVVGFDPRVGVPENVVSGAVVVNFNAGLNLPVLYPHFPLEFAFLFVDRIAFWHSDLLLPEAKMREMAQVFAGLPEGTTAAVSTTGWRDLFSVRHRRFWELIGCTTRAASRDQYEKGCGWWLHFQSHRNRSINSGDSRLSNYYWDHGTGIFYWKHRHGGRVLSLKEKDFSAGHFSQIKFEGYRRVSPNNEFRDLSRDLTGNFELRRCAEQMGLKNLLDGH
ncbi:hypothetical protein [Hydrogenophaga intermedia]|jgi:hypothetical protein|uniref:hypothetical protein n=1 Tax=Hydrogenophaga intermedia TaxID=65786 RepID=UPI002044C86A|nr:hypothetical protein [Hydrogenophaga intermedia]MCM3563258.1 hypothetical protein [Hydrogenophaga intermedia]